jgi:putative transposase
MERGLQAGRTRWTHYQTGYHLVWIPKYRRKVLTADVAAASKDLIAEACGRNGLTLIAVETDVDHVHVFVSAPPRWSPAQIANVLKGYTSRHLRERFPDLKRICGRDQLWTQTYYVGTAGQVAAETIQRYIEECQGK